MYLRSIAMLLLTPCVIACSGHTSQQSSIKKPYPRCATKALSVKAEGVPISVPEEDCTNLTDPLESNDGKDYVAGQHKIRWRGNLATAFSGIGYNTSLNDIAISPSGRIFAVGGPGLQVATNDGKGNSWHVVKHTPFADSLLGLSVLTDKRAFAVGGHRDILDTQNGDLWERFNRTFKSYKDPEYRALKFGNGGGGRPFSMAFSDPDHGVIVGQSDLYTASEYKINGAMLRTEDGGQNWVPVSLPASFTGKALIRLSFVSSTVGWAGGSQGYLLRTDDGSKHWKVVESLVDPSAKEVNFTGLSFSSKQHGCVGGSFKLWCTWDGGLQWRFADIDFPQDLSQVNKFGIVRLAFTDDQNGWFITKEGLIFATKDGGGHWNLWMNIIKAGAEEIYEAEFFGLAIGHGKAWAVGGGSFIDKTVPESSDSISLNNSSIVVSWPI